MILNNEHILSSLPYLKDFFVKNSDYIKIDNRREFLNRLIQNLSEQGWLEFHTPILVNKNYLSFGITFPRYLTKDDVIFFSFRLIDSDISDVSNNMLSNFVNLYKRDYYFLVTYKGIYTNMEDFNVLAYANTIYYNFIRFLIFLKDYNIDSLPFDITSFATTNYKSLALLKIYCTTVRVINLSALTNSSLINETLSVNGSKYYQININLNMDSFFIRFNTSASYVYSYQVHSVYNNPINLLYLSLNDEIYYSLYLGYSLNNFRVGISHFSSSDMVFYPYHVVFSPSPSFYSFGFTYSNVVGVNMERYSTFYRNLIYKNHYNSALFYENRTHEDMNHVVNGLVVNGILPFSNITSNYNINLFNNVSSKFNMNNYNLPNNVVSPNNNYNRNIRKIRLLLNQDFFIPEQFIFTNENPSSSDFNNTINVTYKDLSIIRKMSKSSLTNNL